MGMMFQYEASLELNGCGLCHPSLSYVTHIRYLINGGSIMNFIFIGSLFGALAVAFGAFGAHLLSTRVDAAAMVRWEKAVRMHWYHAMGLFAVGLLEELPEVGHTVMLEVAGGLFQGGLLLFCGGLYAWVLTNRPWLGKVTPIGGLMFLAGWLSIAWAVGG